MIRTPEQILGDAKTIAVVGLSNDPTKDSHIVAKYLQGEGYRVIPVNPTIKEVLGEKSYASLRDIPEPVDIVDVFMRPKALAPLAHDAVAIGAKAFWLQLGIVNEEAAKIARIGGLDVVMDRCVKIVYSDIVRQVRR